MHDARRQDSSSILLENVERINTFAQSILVLRDPLQIGQTALTLLRETFHPALLAVYLPHPAKQEMQLLCASTEQDEFVHASLLRTLPSAAPPLLTEMARQRAPIVMADPQDSILGETPFLNEDTPNQHVRGRLCIPLWCGTSFEGSLLTTFTTPLTLDDVLVQTLVGYALHLATALANARLHLTLEDERTRQRTILDQLPEGTLITEGASGSISYANETAAQILGVPLAQLVGSPLHGLLHAHHPRDDDAWPFVPWSFAIIRALGGEKINRMEALAARPDGASIPVLCASSPLRNVRGTITGAIVTFQDITVQKDVEAQKNLFFAYASHELRTPLTVVKGYADLLQEITAPEHQDQLDLPALHRAVQHIYVQAEQMTYLIDEMLDLARLDQGRFEMHLAPVRLLPLVRYVVKNLAITTNRHQFQLDLDESEASEDVMIQADIMHFHRVLNNLITNAVKYSPQGGEIEVGVRFQDGEQRSALLWVKDHGLGIASGDLSYLFTRFYRAADQNNVIGGLGIGLYLVKEVVECHGGRIWVESVVGQGSTFSLLLPLKS